MDNLITAYEAWNKGKINGFGSFHTTLLTAYRLADLDNKAKLEVAYPEWFIDKAFPL